jgi:YgiT-type zinc finger domain-containing protein
MKRCVACNGEAFVETTEPDEVTVAGRTFTGDVLAKRCATCGEVYVDAPALARFELAVATSIADAGDVNGETFHYLRHALGFTGAALGELLAVPPETISRWETGQQSVDRMAWATVATLATERAEGSTRTFARLRAMQSPPKLANSVRLEVSPVGLR